MMSFGGVELPPAIADLVARSLERAGAAIAIPQVEATELRLEREIGALVRDPERRTRMAAAARGLGKRDAAAHVAEDLLRLARAHASQVQRRVF